MSIAKTITYTLDQLESIVQQLINQLQKCKIMTFTGPLGAGKTTLIRKVLQLSDITDPITSPTFTYLNIYKNPQGQVFYHFDLYRIKNLDEFLQMGFDEYLYVPNSWAFIEWPEIILPLLTHDVCHVAIDYGEDANSRVLTLECR